MNSCWAVSSIFTGFPVQLALCHISSMLRKSHFSWLTSCIALLFGISPVVTNYQELVPCETMHACAQLLIVVTQPPSFPFWRGKRKTKQKRKQQRYGVEFWQTYSLRCKKIYWPQAGCVIILQNFFNSQKMFTSVHTLPFHLSVHDYCRF